MLAVKYFMHKSNASEKETISELKSIYGAEGYATYFIILEKISAGIGEGKNSWSHSSATFSISEWAKFCLVSRKKFREILKFLQEKEKFFLKFYENRGVEMLTIDCPNILKHRDQYAFRKAREEGEKVRTLSVQKQDLSISSSLSKENNLNKELSTISERKEIDENINTQISDVFMHWTEVFAGNDSSAYSVLDETRGASIAKMLRLGYSVDDLKLAIDGCSLSPFYTEHFHTAVSLIFKNADTVEKFIAIAKKYFTKKDKYTEFLEINSEPKSIAFLEIMKKAELQCGVELCLEQLNLYHESLKTYDLAAIEGAIFDFHQKAEAKDGKFPKVKILRDFAGIRQKEINSKKESAEKAWEDVVYWISKNWRIAEMKPCKTKYIFDNPELRNQLPEKLEDFLGNEKAKEKFVELFLSEDKK